MTQTCKSCKHYECEVDPTPPDFEVTFECCSIPVPDFIETALRTVECDPDDYWDSATSGEFCRTFELEED